MGQADGAWEGGGCEIRSPAELRPPAPLRDTRSKLTLALPGAKAPGCRVPADRNGSAQAPASALNFNATPLMQ